MDERDKERNHGILENSMDRRCKVSLGYITAIDVFKILVLWHAIP